MRVGQLGRAVFDHGLAEGEGALHRDGLARAVCEHPRHAVGQGLGMAAVARAPAEVRHQSRRPLGIVLRAHRPDGCVEEVLAALDDLGLAPGSGKCGRGMRTSVLYLVGSFPEISTTATSRERKSMT